MSNAWGRIAAGFFAAMIAAGGSGASAASWSVAQMSGEVTITVAGAQPVGLRREAVLPEGGVLRTGAASRAFLVRNAETISVGPSAAIAVPPGDPNGEFTTVLQNAGLVAFSVDKRNVQHFSVETPYLAALVKGTEFSVEVTPSGATVRVSRGIVEVTALRNGYVTMITAGEGVTVNVDGSLAFAGIPGQPQVIQGVPRAPIIGATLASLQRAAPVNIGIGGTTASLRTGTLSIGAQGGNSASADAAVDGLNLGAGVTSGGSIKMTAGPGGIRVDGLGVIASAGSNDVEASVGGAGVSAGASGVEVDAGPTHLGLSLDQ
jgi:hypothetical protein